MNLKSKSDMKIVSDVSGESIAQAIKEIKSNPEKLANQKASCLAAAEIENWENEQLKLKKLFNKKHRKK